MDPERLAQLLRGAQEAMRQGASYNEVNERIRQITNGQIPGLMSLQLAADPIVRAEEARAQDLRVATEHSPVSNFNRMFAQGATFGWADEAAGGFASQRAGVEALMGGEGLRGASDAALAAWDETVEGSRERVDALRTTNPGASLAAEGAGIVATAPFAGRGLFDAMRGGGGALRTGRAAAGTGAIEGGLIAAGEAEGGPVERALPTAAGAGAGAMLGVGAQGAVAGGQAAMRVAGGLFRTTSQAARAALTRTAQRAGLAPGDLPGAVRALGDDAVLADIPAFGAQAPGALRTAVSRPETAITALRARVNPEQVAAAKRAIWKPLEDTNVAVDDPKLLRFLRSNPVTNEILARVRGSASGVNNLNFRELQSVRELLSRQMKPPALSHEIGDAIAASQRLDSYLDQLVPGFRPARRQYAELMDRVQGRERFQAAIDAAFPAFDPGLPTVSSGAVRSELFNMESRRQRVGELISELLLEDGGAERASELIRSGALARVATQGAGNVARQTGQTEVGRLFGSMVEPQGLLAPNDPAPLDVSSPGGLLNTGLGGSY